ncbi:hypothetical protein BU25DRAFT_131609 [Macroventuria anomochaeta]|uniref:Uncharacterized protein n=1 Tax=Macroventuria anomochaeta TaxID=301207 RepID=A0ACB6RRY1_9PLEO|nr:uncharacterized protein BU25DRAFT_131609 [Macroventuria anomochaeta]KAF2624661.1 hypothetical protein BU25DRAFT_131609 [Macroventuria anomochaeta]
MTVTEKFNRLSRLVPFLGYHHVLMIVQISAVIMMSILLAGCSSYSTMTNVYILGLSYTNSTPSNLGPVERAMFDTLHSLKGSAQLEVRIGYFGMCVRQRGIVWLCSSDSSGLAQQIGPENDPLNLIGAASSFKDDVLFSGLIFMSVILAFFCFVLLATFPGWHEERDVRTGSDVDVKPFPSRPVSQVALACTFVAAVLMLVASLWQHIGAVGAAAMAESSNYGNVKTDIGAGAMLTDD